MELITRRDLLLQYNNPSWRVSIHKFNGDFIPASHTAKINFFDVLSHCKNKFVCDSNSSWKVQASRVVNRNKCFIVSKPTMDEQRDFYNNLFGNTDYLCNENIYIISVLPELTGVAIEHFTKELTNVRDSRSLKQTSKARVKGNDEEIIKAEQEFMDDVKVDKNNILKILSGFDLDCIKIGDLAALKQASSLKASILGKMDKVKYGCYRNFFLCNDVVYLCYAALLLESDNVGTKTRKEFSEGKRNTFGDITIMRDALWLNAKFLSNDNAVKRMADYLNLPKIKVVGIV